jgi:hypothetical protein
MREFPFSYLYEDMDHEEFFINFQSVLHGMRGMLYGEKGGEASW